MTETSPNIPRIAFISALFGILAAFVAGWAFTFSILGAILIGLLVALIVAIILWLGWTEPQATATATMPAESANSSATTAVGTDAVASKSSAASAAPAAVATMPTSTPTARVANEVAAPAPAKPAAAKAAKPAAAKAAKPAAAKAAKPAVAKPVVLAKARAGGADDLKMIKGVGPVLEKALNASGVFHFDQVAVWKKSDAVWFDENVKGANGRVVRDEWVKQAKILAKGGTTEFASKVKKGGVY